MQTKTLNPQGLAATKIFSGKGKSKASKKMYFESPILFSRIIRDEFSEGKYNLVDLGGFKGEFLQKVLFNLNGYCFYKIGVDNDLAIKDNLVTDKNIKCNLDKIEIESKFSEITLLRYVLNWNSWRRQMKIIDEAIRITKGICIIQHIGPDDEKAEMWRDKFEDIFSGEIIFKTKRNNNYFSSKKEIENNLKKINIKFKVVQSRKIKNVFDTLAERFKLSSQEYRVGRKILGKMDYAIQTTWVIYSQDF